MTLRIHKSDTVKCPKCKQQIKSWETRCSKCGTEIKRKPVELMEELD